MRTVLLTIPFILMAGSAFAQAGEFLIMSCASSRALVQKRGAVLMCTGPNIFDRYVSNQSFCAGNEMTKPAWIATVGPAGVSSLDRSAAKSK